MTDATDLDAQLGFVLELDLLKRVERRTTLTDASRQENSAEHSWHLAMMALVLADHAPEGVDVGRVVQMVLVHDIVEIDAGDAFVYDPGARDGKLDRERAAADRLFGMLPRAQGDRLRALWEEFAARESPDARFAAALDRLQPLLLNRASGGVAWRRHGIVRSQVLEVNAHIADGSPSLWDAARDVIDDASRAGLLPDT